LRFELRIPTFRFYVIGNTEVRVGEKVVAMNDLVLLDSYRLLAKDSSWIAADKEEFSRRFLSGKCLRL
jgi:hypothetical protein